MASLWNGRNAFSNKTQASSVLITSQLVKCGGNSRTNITFTGSIIIFITFFRPGNTFNHVNGCYRWKQCGNAIQHHLARVPKCSDQIIFDFNVVWLQPLWWNYETGEINYCWLFIMERTEICQGQARPITLYFGSVSILSCNLEPVKLRGWFWGSFYTCLNYDSLSIASPPVMKSTVQDHFWCLMHTYAIVHDDKIIVHLIWERLALKALKEA